MDVFSDFENYDFLNYAFSGENEPPALSAKDIEANTTRFPNLTENDIEQIKNSNVKVNTGRSTKTWVNVWSKCSVLQEE